MPVSKKTQSAVNSGAKVYEPEPTGRAAKRAAPKAATAPKKARSNRQAPRDASEYAASAWGTVQQFELTTPSGQTCLAHELTIERLIEMGLLEMVNSLSGIVDSEVLPKAQGQPTIDMGKLLGNAEHLVKVMGLVNQVVVEAVDAPKLWPAPEDGEARLNGRVYVDSVGMEDRFFLFTEVTGNLEGLASFRSEPE